MNIKILLLKTKKKKIENLINHFCLNDELATELRQNYKSKKIDILKNIATLNSNCNKDLLNTYHSLEEWEIIECLCNKMNTKSKECKAFLDLYKKCSNYKNYNIAKDIIIKVIKTNYNNESLNNFMQLYDLFIMLPIAIQESTTVDNPKQYVINIMGKRLKRNLSFLN